MRESDASAARSDASRPRVAGVGASAGGLEALEGLFAEMPTDTGIAFVVVQHLAPDFESMMDEIIARRTALPVRRVTDGVTLQPDTVYVIPPGKEMIVSSGRLLLTDKSREVEVPRLVDLFFRSLAREAGSDAIGIVLSGGGTDGAVGVRAIHDAGGFVLVQTPATARVDGMPTAAIATGIADLELAPEEMAMSLVRYVRETTPRRVEGPRDRHHEGDSLDTVLELIREHIGIDFSNYKSNTVTRRIHRRLMFHPAREMGDMLGELRSNPRGLDTLYKDLLIGVTQFFRDSDAWTALADEAIPTIVRELEPGAELRAWVPGCATGEEAYSLALLLREQLEAMSRPDINVKIFATDVHPDSLEIANSGVYSEDSLEAVSVQRRERFFTRHGDGWRIAPEIRQMIVFARHDVTSDPPFTRLQLVSCRNLLIYLKPETQQKVMSLFHFGLRPGGYLFLGSSESAHGADEAFDTVNRRQKLYRRVRDMRVPAAVRTAFANTLPSEEGPGRGPAIASAFGTRMLGVYDVLLERYMPPSLLVDESFSLLHTFGGAGRWLRVHDGRASTNVLEMVDPDLEVPLTGALQRCRKEQTEVVYTGIRGPSEGTETKIVVRPVRRKGSDRMYMTISFEELQARPPAPASRTEIDIGEVSAEQLEYLEHELQHTRENLQATIEELETSNEELQTTNEEVVASNEELQSTNEELQSVNEELYTVNAELQDKIAQLTELANDVDNLLEATDVGTVFLDRRLRIRKFTPAIASLFDLLPQDVGRPISAFTHRIDDDELMNDLSVVLGGGAKIEREVLDHDGRCFFLRILPYCVDGHPAGVVLTLVDMAAIKEAENALFRERYLLRSLMELVPDPIAFKDADGRYVRVNTAAARALGLQDPQQAVGKKLSEIRSGPAVDRAEARERAIVATGEPIDAELEEERGSDSDVRWNLTSKLPLRDENDVLVGTLSISRNITAQKQAENEAREAVRRRDRFLAMLSHELRNPLGAISSAIQIIEPNSLSRPKRRPFEIAQRQVRHMARMLDDLLDVSRVMQDRIELRREPLDLVEVTQSCLDAARIRFQDRDIELRAELPDEAVGVSGDRHRLEQCIDNLLSNALRYGGRGSNVRIELVADGSSARLSISDEGVGIEPELLEAIFEPFIQSDQSLDRKGAGMGLGLSVVRALVQRHDGRVEAHSDGPGKGATFTMRFPQCALTQRRRPPSHNGRDLEGLRVVVVEDDADNREMVTAMLELGGCEVLEAADGREGVEVIERECPDVAVVDLGLPEVDGFELAARVRNRSGARVRLVAVSGYGQPADRERAKERGFDAHLVKPVPKDLLFETLGSLVGPTS